MKFTVLVGLALVASTSFGQITAPKLSPKAEIKQTVGLTTLEVIYSRPAVREREIFGSVVPYNEVWRTGANENTIFSSTDAVVFGSDTLPAGKYSVYSRPSKTAWDLIFYATTDNWGNPDEWKEENVVLTVNSKSKTTSSSVESFTIGFENVTTKSGTITLSWDKTTVGFNFTVPTDEKMDKMISNVMAGPSGNDYYRAADYYLNEGKNYEQALEWINKAIAAQEEAPFWMLRRKSLIQAGLKDYKGAIETAKLSLAGAEKAGHKGYINMNKTSIEEWSKMK